MNEREHEEQDTNVNDFDQSYYDLIDEVIDEVFESDEPVTIEDRRAMGDDMLYPTYNIFGEWEN